MWRKTLARADICDLEVSAVGLGCNNFGRRLDARGSAAVIDAAIDAGVTFFDTAEAYGDGESEDFIGRALGGRRPQVRIATKFGLSGRATPSRIASALEASLRRLRTDYVDLYQIHRPDPNTPIEETLAAMDRLAADGKVRWIGCSNFSAQQIRAAHEVSGARGLARFVTAQNAYSVLDRAVETGLLPACVEAGVGLLPYYPLANGILTGKYRRGVRPPAGARLGDGRARGTAGLNDAAFDKIEALARIASERGYELLDLAISWLATRPGVSSVIAGARTPEQAIRNAAAAAWRMDEADLAAIEAVAGGRRAPPGPAPSGAAADDHTGIESRARGSGKGAGDG